MLRLIRWGALAVVAAALVACGGGGAASASKPAGGAPAGGGAASGGAAQEVTLKSTDQFRFQPDRLTVRANQPVRLTLDNTGAALVHDFVIDNAGGQKVQIRAQPNSRAMGSFTLPAGTYQFYCSEPGHKEAGMVGTLTVN